MLTYIVIGCFLFSFYLFLIHPRRFKRKETMNLFQVSYAHRGLHNLNVGIPENSLPAFSHALLHGYGIELDIQLTKDEKVVVFHDTMLSRVCGLDVPLVSKTYEELQELSLFSTNEKIPLLTDVLKLINGSVPLLIEIKLTNLNTRTCFLADQILRTYQGAYMIESFNPMALRWYKLHHPSVIRGQLSANLFGRTLCGSKILTSLLPSNLFLNFLSRPDFLSYNYKDTNNINYKILTKIFHIPVMGWTFMSEKDYLKHRFLFNSIIFENFIPY